MSDDRSMNVAALREVLAELPGSFRLVPNEVGNLKIKDDAGEYAGYVEFSGLASEALHLFARGD